MPSPTARQSHIDVALTTVAVAYSNAAYIGGQIFPQVPVAKQTNKFFTFPKASWFRDEAAIRAPGARARRADYTLSTDSYLCLEKALAHQVTPGLPRSGTPKPRSSRSLSRSAVRRRPP